ncbi:hypothetical protein S7711_03149 [Stachybotrys chartarum IBT 7711]|uniref:WW domain-containing protein n=1 Tax=Stachybotrys chartarum (strain CBS 109288 / IBT 7711) TaxID=1280523 RepID=A0A084AWI6_STACB|nr:hypothetical protein S7711_03149 [Stachybotrys chartarum IBT 7711]KFA49306.1 hypothetical protein S40293_04196 [Stachybotrys chartarum IBT 40293]KFA80456.1 hypothetical protein S40288_02093 [Stachybotrys chartarum IBT 40288]
MSDFAPPVGPPPPRAPEVPAGWTARWNDQYKEWFYVNIYTKQSQWEKPFEPVYPPQDDNGPLGAPPSYQPGHSPAPSDVKTNPYLQTSGVTPGAGSSSQVDEDARLAAELQAQEESRSRTGGYGGPNPPPGYGSHPQGQQNYSQQLPPREQKKSGGFLGKLLSKGSSRISQGGGGSHYGAPMQGHYGGHQGGYPGGHMSGGYGQPHYSQGHHGGGYGGHGGHGYPPQAYGRSGRSGGGMGGAMGGAALGVGAGMLGGYMVADAINDGQEDAYEEGFGKLYPLLINPSTDRFDDDGGGGDDGGE